MNRVWIAVMKSIPARTFMMGPVMSFFWNRFIIIPGHVFFMILHILFFNAWIIFHISISTTSGFVCSMLKTLNLILPEKRASTEDIKAGSTGQVDSGLLVMARWISNPYLAN